MAVAGVLAAAGAGTVLAILTSEDEAPAAAPPSAPMSERDAPAPEPTPAAPSSTPAPAVPEWCPAGQLRGAYPGGADTAIGAIFALQHAYYVERSGAAAAALLAGDGLPSAEQIQQGIDTIPAGTQHCLGVTLSSPASAQVLVAQRTPDGTLTTFKQTVTFTQSESGSWVITSLE